MVQAIEFRDALKDFPSGVTIITSADENGTPIGATVSAFSSLSLDPPLILVCLANWTRTAEAIRQRGSFVVNFLDESQGRLARHFAADIEDKFANVPYTLNSSGTPYLDECHLRLECSLETAYNGGDHEIFVGRVQHSARSEAFEPIVFARRGFYSLGNQLVEV